MMKKLLLVFCLSLLTYSIIPLQRAEAETVTQTRYLTGESSFMFFVLNGIFNPNLRNFTQTQDFFDMLERNVTNSYDGNIQIGFRMFKQFYDYDYNIYYEEITSGVTLLFEKENTFEGWQTAFYNMTEMNITRSDMLSLTFWARFKTTLTVWSSWFSMVLKSAGLGYNEFYTESLGYSRILSSIWNFTFYLKLQRITLPLPIKRMVRIYLGNTTYSSGISNMQFGDVVSPEIEQYEVLAILGLACGVIALGVAVVLKK